jgi:hypothetical protein
LSISAGFAGEFPAVGSLDVATGTLTETEHEIMSSSYGHNHQSLDSDRGAPIWAALLALHQAHDRACELGRSPWDFAVEIQSLRALGTTNTDLRWLKCLGYVDHATDITLPGQEGRSFRKTGPLTFGKGTCFVITEDGVVLLKQGPAAVTPRNSQKGNHVADSDTLGAPRWDRVRQELRLGPVLVKQFKVRAPNQEMILTAFEEEGWPPRIDDPLPPVAGQDSKRRLHDTIVTLNRNQKSALLRFSGDGSGEGVLWEAVAPSAADLGEVHS